MAIRRFVLILLGSFVAHARGDNLNLGGYRINIDGYETMTFGRPDGLSISLSPGAFVEMDQHGNVLPGNAHMAKVSDMTSQNVTIGDACSKIIPNSNTEGRFLNVDAILEGDRQGVLLGYDVYYVTAAGAFIMNKELQRITANNVILTLMIEGWKWCAPCDGNDGDSVTGAFLDFLVNVELPGSAVVEEQDVNNGPREITLGNQMTLYLSNQVKCDKVWQTVPEGYPKLSLEPGEATTYNMIIRLPKFDKRVMYALVFSLDDLDTEFRQPINDSSKITCSKENGGDVPLSGVEMRPNVLLCFLAILMLSGVQRML